MKKRGQMKISFGMIFSIILIIVFLTFAFFAIKTFLGFTSSAQSGKFLSDFQSDIDRVWKSSQSSQQINYSIPGKIEYVCFVNFDGSAKGQSASFYKDLQRSYYGGGENLAFYPFGSSDVDSREMDHINIGAITSNENPYCVKNIDGEVSLTLKKDFSENLVRIER